MCLQSPTRYLEQTRDNRGNQVKLYITIAIANVELLEG